MNRRTASCLGAAVVLMLPAVAYPQSFPARPVRIVTSEPGSGNDLVSRVIAQGITPVLGQQVIVENRGVGAVELVARANPDGHNLVLYGTPLWLLGFMRSKVPWDPVRDFTPVTLATNAPNILVVHPAVPVKSVQDLVALAKAKPGELNYGSGSTGSTTHLAAELFKSMAGVDMVRIPYKGAGLALNGLLAGQFQVILPSANAVAPHIAAGKVRAIAVASLQPSVLAPGLPTISASGLPGYESSSILGVFAPARTPPEVVARLSREMQTVLHRSEVRDRLLAAGVEPVGSTPEQLAATVKSEMTRLGKLIRDVGIRDE